VEREIRTVGIEDLEVRADDTGTGIRGYAAVFDKLSLNLGGFREKIAPGAFKYSVENKRRILALWNHDSNLPIGSTDGGQLKLSEDSRGLFFDLQPINTSTGRDVQEMIRSGVVKGVSFGFVVKKDAWDQTDPRNVVRTLVDVDLIEISPTAFPAYPQTTAAVRSEEDVFRSYLATQERAGEEKPAQTQEPMDVLAAEIEILKKM
jgi:HK97 family phage prohead protease